MCLRSSIQFNVLFWVSLIFSPVRRSSKYVENSESQRYPVALLGLQPTFTSRLALLSFFAIALDNYDLPTCPPKVLLKLRLVPQMNGCFPLRHLAPIPPGLAPVPLTYQVQSLPEVAL